MTIEPTFVTASLLYNLVACPHRVTLDIFGDPTKRDEPNAFVELLWEKGSQYEHEVIFRLKAPFVDLSGISGKEKERLTLDAMSRREAMIYAGRITAADLVGEPDLLRREGTGYIAGDIKSGAGEDGPDENSRPKAHYAVQLSLYTDILEQLGMSGGRHAFVWDIHGDEVLYDFDAPQGKRDPRTLWQDYREALQEARAIIRGKATLPAASATCKLCHWYSACKQEIKEADDLTMIPELGRAKRDIMIASVRTVTDLAHVEPSAFIDGKKTIFPGIGPDTLRKFHQRAKLLSTKGAKPYLRAPIHLPKFERELFFDIEVDPMRDVCYLHGFVERTAGDNSTEIFVSAFADDATPEAERRAFEQAWAYIRQSRPCAVFYYSKYERTIYRKLALKFPGICTPEEIEDLFDPVHAVDLYNDVVKKATEWPTWDFSIKSLAKYLGFSWRDTHPSGAASIEWFHRWVETGDTAIRQRVLDYNEDDCRATRVLRDALETLPLVPEDSA